MAPKTFEGSRINKKLPSFIWQKYFLQHKAIISNIQLFWVDYLRLGRDSKVASMVKHESQPCPEVAQNYRYIIV